MKIKLDENLPLQIASSLRSHGHDVHTLTDEGLLGCDDSDLWRAAQREGRTLITQDLDFSDKRRFAPGTHFGIILVRLRNPSRIRLVERVKEICLSEDIDMWAGCFVVLTEHKLRVSRASN